jgi:SAM-dependent methyltransferase
MAESTGEEGGTSSVGLGTVPVREGREGSAWFHEHFVEAADQIIEFLRGDGIELSGRDVADVGSGDGIIDLGVSLKAKPRSLTGFDIDATEKPRLIAFSQREGVADELPEGLEFRKSEQTRLPADDRSFDVVFSWSTFEHVSEPIDLLRDIRRTLRGSGVLMIQVWPFYYSQHGSHLWQYFPEGFAQLMLDEEDLESRVRANPGPDVEWSERLLAEYRSCNRITLDGLQSALLAADFRIGKLELLTEALHIPPALGHFPLSQLGVSGVKLLATPTRPD